MLSYFEILEKCEEEHQKELNREILELEAFFKDENNINVLRDLVRDYALEISELIDSGNPFRSLKDEIRFSAYKYFKDFEAEVAFVNRKRIEEKNRLDKEIIKMRFSRKYGRTFSREETALRKRIDEDYIAEVESEYRRRLNCCYPGKPVYKKLSEAVEEFKRSMNKS